MMRNKWNALTSWRTWMDRQTDKSGHGKHRCCHCRHIVSVIVMSWLSSSLPRHSCCHCCHCCCIMAVIVIVSLLSLSLRCSCCHYHVIVIVTSSPCRVALSPHHVMLSHCHVTLSCCRHHIVVVVTVV